MLKSIITSNSSVIIAAPGDWNVVQDNRVDTFNYTGENNPKSKFGGFQKKIESIFLSVLLTQFFFSGHVDLG